MKCRHRSKVVANAIRRADSKGLLRVDPTRTLMLRRRFTMEVRKQFAILKGILFKAIATEDFLGLKEKKQQSPSQFLSSAKEGIVNTRWQPLTPPEKLAAFRAWFRQQVQETITSRSARVLWQRYAEEGFRRGAGRSFDDVNRSRLIQVMGEPAKLDFFNGSKDQFLRSAFGQPVTVEKIDLLASRSFSDLEGVTEEMGTRISRTLVDGLTEGKGAIEVARDMTEQVDVSKGRAETIARTELVRAHAEGQLTALELMGVEEVGVAVEWSTSGLNTFDKKGRPLSPCVKCQPMAGTVLKIDEARGMIPFHPNCMCAWIPANVGEDQSDQKNTQESIQGALEQAGVEGKDIAEDRPESIMAENRLTLLYAFSRSLQVVANGWVTLDSGQRVFVGEDGQFQPSGPRTVHQVKESATGTTPASSASTSKLERSTRPETEGMEMLPKGSSDAVKAVSQADVDQLHKTATQLDEEGNQHVELAAISTKLGWDRPKLATVLQASFQRGKASPISAEGYGGVSEGEAAHHFASSDGKERYSAIRPVVNVAVVDLAVGDEKDGREGDTHNRFCATGEGGGVDPTCGMGDEKGEGKGSAVKTAKPQPMVSAAEQVLAEVIKEEIANMVGGIPEQDTDDAGQRDKKPYDVKVPSGNRSKKGTGDHDIEVKSVIISKDKNRTLSVHDDALLRKVEHQERNPKNAFHTVAVDDREKAFGGANKEVYSGHRLYYRRGSGKYSLNSMHRVKDAAELKKLLSMKDHELPEKAKGQLPPPPPKEVLRERAAKAKESRDARDKIRKERKKAKLQEQARARYAKKKAEKAAEK